MTADEHHNKLASDATTLFLNHGGALNIDHGRRLLHRGLNRLVAAPHSFVGNCSD